jgi:hypothetical protein
MLPTAVVDSDCKNDIPVGNGAGDVPVGGEAERNPPEHAPRIPRLGLSRSGQRYTSVKHCHAGFTEVEPHL